MSGLDIGAGLCIQDACRVLGGRGLSSPLPSTGRLPCAPRACAQPRSLIFGKCSRCRKSSLLDACLAWRVSLLLVAPPGSRPCRTDREETERGASERSPAFHPQGFHVNLQTLTLLLSEGRGLRMHRWGSPFLGRPVLPSPRALSPGGVGERACPASALCLPRVYACSAAVLAFVEWGEEWGALRRRSPPLIPRVLLLCHPSLADPRRDGGAAREATELDDYRHCHQHLHFT